jgi:hypothetical protein
VFRKKDDPGFGIGFGFGIEFSCETSLCEFSCETSLCEFFCFSISNSTNKTKKKQNGNGFLWSLLIN